jgi:ATP-dependent DNA helicase RecG
VVQERQAVQQFFDFEFAESKPEVLLGLLTPDEIYHSAETLLNRIKEDCRVERKNPNERPEPLGDYFSMWANTSPYGGVIAYGIADDGTVVGCENCEQKHINRIENSGQDYAPGAVYEYKRIRATRPDGKDDWIILFRVQYHPTRVIETVKRKVFVRRGDRCIELRTDEERRQLRFDKGEIQFEQEASGLIYPQDFDNSLIAQFTGNVKKIRGIDPSMSDLKILTSLRLGSRDGQNFIPNVACALLFANDPVRVIPGAKIHFLRYEGGEEKHGRDFNETANMPPIEGPIPKQIDHIDRILGERIRRFQGFGDDGKFHTTPEYPRDAWYEAIVNACVHRSYNFRNRKIFVRMFDDRLEFESPGPFPPGVTPETIYEVQHSRNPFIMEAMRYLGYVREIGEGVPRIRQEMLQLGLPAPEFLQSELANAMVLVTLRNNKPIRKMLVDEDVARIVGESITSQLTPSEKIVVNYVIVAESITVTEACRQTGHTWHTCRKLLDGLVIKQILEHKKRPGAKIDRQGRYILKRPIQSSAT